MGELAEHIDLSACTEYTVEAGRPDTITAEKLAVLKRRGCDRVSVNPQSMSDAVLAAMGRAHRAADILGAFALVRESGIGCVNMDLIAGLPGDSADGFRASLDQVLELAPENVTVHTLALKKGSRLMNGAPNKGKALVGERTSGGMSELPWKQGSEGYKAREDEGETPLPPGEDVAAMLDYAWAALRESGQIPYYLYRQKYMSGSFENVGWCKPGFTGLYNICMMEELHTILSLGGGGMTKVNLGPGQLQRFHNPKIPADYVARIDQILAQKEQIFALLEETDSQSPCL